MISLLAIVRRETGAFFHSAMAPVVLTGFLVLTGFSFTLYVFSFSDASQAALTAGQRGAYLNVTEGVFRPLFLYMVFFVLLFLPAVTMRLFSAEYRSRRYDLITSWPVSDGGWVVGKWLSAVVVAAALVGACGAFMAAIALLGKPEPGPLLGAAGGVFLLAAATAAWGTAFSALFSYQLVAYLLTFAMMAGLLLAGYAETFLPTALGRQLAELALLEHVQRFARGVLDSRDVIYLVGLTIFGLVLATQALAARRLAAGRRLARVGPTVALGLVLLAVQLLASRYPLTIDLTPDRRYSLAPQTVQILDSLAAGRDLLGEGEVTQRRDIVVYAFYSATDPASRNVAVLLQAMTDRSRRFRYEMVDPERDIERVREFGVTNTRTVVVASGEQAVSLLEPGESELISAVYRLVTGARPVIYFVHGHGEHLLDSEEVGGYARADELLRSQGYDVQLLRLAELLEIPSDAAVVVLAGPKNAPLPEELAAIDRFIAGGGALLALLDPTMPDEIRTWMVRYGVEPAGDVLVSADRANRQFGVGARTIVVYEGYGRHAITRGMEGVATIFPLAQSLADVPAEIPAVGNQILRTGPLTWSERDPDSRYSGRAEFDRETDVPGPLPFGVALQVDIGRGNEGSGPDLRRPRAPSRDRGATATEGDGSGTGRPNSIFDEKSFARLVVIGNSEFASNANLGLFGNRDFLLNTFGWLAREEVLIQLRGRDLVSRPVVLTAEQKEMLGWGSVLIWPLLVGAGSLILVLRHRRSR